jgi:hypothetical protein
LRRFQQRLIGFYPMRVIAYKCLVSTKFLRSLIFNIIDGDDEGTESRHSQAWPLKTQTAGVAAFTIASRGGSTNTSIGFF